MEPTEFNAQVSKERYYKTYDNLKRFIAYFYQVDLTRKLRPKTVLEIGIGNKTVSNYLRAYGFDVTTCDFDKDLEPDYVADIRELPFDDNSYDVVLAYEILEHLPWDDVDKALGELHRVTKKYVNVSVPYSAISFELIFTFPLIDKILKRDSINLVLRIPQFFREIRFISEHYWAIGRKNYPIGKVRKLLRRRFKILKEVRPVLSFRHHFFTLEKR